MKNIIKEYLGHLKRMCGFAKRTLSRHQSICASWEKFLISNRNRDLLTAKPVDLLSFIKYRQTIGNVKNVTISGELCILRTLYCYLYDFQIIQFNPAASLPELICEPPAEKKYLTVMECFNLLESINTDDQIGLRDYTMIALLWSSGLRPSELCSLDRRDINLREGSLLVRKGRHILIQPISENSPYYLLVDDLSIQTIQYHHKNYDGTWKPGRMVVETSPNNYQVWIHSNRFLPITEKRYWLKKLCNDPGADPNNRWGRCPGFRNRIVQNS